MFAGRANDNEKAAAGSALDQLLMGACRQAAVLDVQPRLGSSRDWLTRWRGVVAIQARPLCLSCTKQGLLNGCCGFELSIMQRTTGLEQAPRRGGGANRLPVSAIPLWTGLPT